MEHTMYVLKIQHMKDILLKKYSKHLKRNYSIILGCKFSRPEIINKNKYCFCDINNNVSLKRSIENVCKNPIQYIDGELFTKNATKQMQLFYSTLLDNILLHLRY